MKEMSIGKLLKMEEEIYYREERKKINKENGSRSKEEN